MQPFKRHNILLRSGVVNVQLVRKTICTRNDSAPARDSFFSLALFFKQSKIRSVSLQWCFGKSNWHDRNALLLLRASTGELVTRECNNNQCPRITVLFRKRTRWGSYLIFFAFLQYIDPEGNRDRVSRAYTFECLLVTKRKCLDRNKNPRKRERRCSMKCSGL